jgi:hypothetical protein
MNARQLLLPLAVLLLSAASVSAKDRVWRCTDAQGRTVYQDSACAAATESRNVQAADPRDAAAVAEARQRAQAEQALGEKLAKQRRQDEREAMLKGPIRIGSPPAPAASANDKTKPRARPVESFRPPGSLQKSGASAP